MQREEKITMELIYGYDDFEVTSVCTLTPEQYEQFMSHIDEMDNLIDFTPINPETGNGIDVPNRYDENGSFVDYPTAKDVLDAIWRENMPDTISARLTDADGHVVNELELTPREYDDLATAMKNKAAGLEVMDQATTAAVNMGLRDDTAGLEVLDQATAEIITFDRLVRDDGTPMSGEEVLLRMNGPDPWNEQAEITPRPDVIDLSSEHWRQTGYFEEYKGKEDIEHIINHSLNHDTGGVLAMQNVGSTYYMAVRSRENGLVYGVIAGAEVDGHPGDQGVAYKISYFSEKAVETEMEDAVYSGSPVDCFDLPCGMRDCPDGILDMLSPKTEPEHEFANWRNECRETNDLRRSMMNAGIDCAKLNHDQLEVLHLAWDPLSEKFQKAISPYLHDMVGIDYPYYLQTAYKERAGRMQDDINRIHTIDNAMYAAERMDVYPEKIMNAITSTDYTLDQADALLEWMTQFGDKNADMVMNPNLTCGEIKEAENGFLSGLTRNEVKSYLYHHEGDNIDVDTKFPYPNNMMQDRVDLTYEKAYKIAAANSPDGKLNFDPEQEYQLKNCCGYITFGAYATPLPIEAVASVMDPNLSPDEIFEFRENMWAARENLGVFDTVAAKNGLYLIADRYVDTGSLYLGLAQKGTGRIVCDLTTNPQTPAAEGNIYVEPLLKDQIVDFMERNNLGTAERSTGEQDARMFTNMNLNMPEVEKWTETGKEYLSPDWQKTQTQQNQQSQRQKMQMDYGMSL